MGRRLGRLEALIDGQVVLETPEFVDLEACVAIADSLVARLLDRANSG